MKKYNSVVFRLTAMVFILLFLTIAILLFLVNDQMNSQFTSYLQMNAAMMNHGSGMAERHYISSVHQSLLWVGIGMVIASVAISYAIVRKLMTPLLSLTDAVKNMESGKFGQAVPITRYDEVGLLGQTINDMSERLAKNDRMRRHLFANIAHELRTPLAIIQGNLEGMIDDVIIPDKRTFLSMEDEVLRMGRLIQDLRDLSLAEINELTLHKELIDLNELLEQAANMLQPLCDEKELEVHLRLSADIPPVMADKDRINQVIYNILTNAIRYIERGCIICITTSIYMIDNTKMIKATIADNGIGIPEKDLPYVFHYFYRSEKSRNRKSGGSGIGLALAKQFIRSHGGMITATSEVHKGTTFTFTLPV